MTLRRACPFSGRYVGKVISSPPSTLASSFASVFMEAGPQYITLNHDTTLSLSYLPTSNPVRPDFLSTFRSSTGEKVAYL